MDHDSLGCYNILSVLVFFHSDKFSLNVLSLEGDVCRLENDLEYVCARIPGNVAVEIISTLFQFSFDDDTQFASDL